MAFLKALALCLMAFITAALASTSLPLSTSSRWILDSAGARVKLRCINWAGHMETHVPEGLHRAAIPDIAAFIASQGFNCVRLTYSTDWALNPNETVADAFTNAAALAGVPDQAAAFSTFYTTATEYNPSLLTTTVREVYSAVIDALWANSIMTILDNHVSHASWCCDLDDGNGWWDDAIPGSFGLNDGNSRFFNTSAWLDGLDAVAAWSVSQPGVIGLSLRNELRQDALQALDFQPWYSNIVEAGNRVHAANPDALVIVGGGLSATDLTAQKTGLLDFSGWAGKHVWEFHAYSFTVTFTLDPFGWCGFKKDSYGFFDGFVLEQGKGYTAPLILSEFGVAMSTGTDGHAGLSSGDSDYLSCLVEYMEDNDAEWALWAVQGSYYVREGTIDYNETWGLYNYEWKDLRNSAFPALLGNMWKVTQGP